MPDSSSSKCRYEQVTDWYQRAVFSDRVQALIEEACQAFVEEAGPEPHWLAYGAQPGGDSRFLGEVERIYHRYAFPAVERLTGRP
jgi:hypothetical protein